MTKPSTLPFDQETLGQGIRVCQAQFARMCGVSKQAVNQWVVQGKITLYPDGTLDPARAAREVMDNSDPSRLRAKVFRAAASDVGELRKDIAALTQKLDAASKRIDYLEDFTNESSMSHEIFLAMLIARLKDIRQLDCTISFANMLSSIYDDAILAASGELGRIDEDTGKPFEVVGGRWRIFFSDGVAFVDRAALGEEGGGG